MAKTGRGWHRESARHALAAKGVKTRRTYQRKMMTKDEILRLFKEKLAQTKWWSAQHPDSYKQALLLEKILGLTDDEVKEISQEVSNRMAKEVTNYSFGITSAMSLKVTLLGFEEADAHELQSALDRIDKDPSYPNKDDLRTVRRIISPYLDDPDVQRAVKYIDILRDRHPPEKVYDF